VPIAGCNGVDPSLHRGLDDTVAYVVTQAIHPRGQRSEEWLNCTDYRSKHAQDHLSHFR
jgi:hypothetical protein